MVAGLTVALNCGVSFSTVPILVAARFSIAPVPMIVVGVGAVKPERWMRDAVTTISDVSPPPAAAVSGVDWTVWFSGADGGVSPAACARAPEAPSMAIANMLAELSIWPKRTPVIS